jgi:hypothetical protein
MKSQFKLSLVIVVLSLFSVPAVAASHDQGMTKQAAFQSTMRKLWEDHIVWTRQFIVSAVADAPDKAAATERLLQNQVDVGNAVKGFYGDAAGEKLTALLKDHTLIAAEVVAAAKANDTAKLQDASKR